VTGLRVPLLAVLATALLPTVGRADDLPLEVRLDGEQTFLLGRPDLLEERMEGASTPLDRWPFALRDLWWRPDPARRPAYEADANAATGLLARRYAWLLGGGAGPYPTPEAGEADPWPALSALVLDRVRRETEGAHGYPDQSPIATLAPHSAWADWYPAWRDFFLQRLMGVGYGGGESVAAPVPPEGERGDLRTRNALVAIGSGAALLALAALIGWRAGRRRPHPANAP
jgi:hypothetical protein